MAPNLLCTILTAALFSPMLAAQDKAALLQRMHSTEETTSLDDAQLKPWHLKVDVQLYDTAGKPAETAVVEEWWAGSNQTRTSYTSTSYTATNLHNLNGLFRTPGFGSPPFYFEQLLHAVVHPMPSQLEVDASKPDLRKQAIIKVDLDCIMLDQDIRNVAYPPLGLFPTYCLGRNDNLLRLSFGFGGEVTTLNKIGAFQGKHVATEVAIQANQVLAATAHVAELKSGGDTTDVFTNTTGLAPYDEKPVDVPGDVIAGRPLKKVAPSYPESAKQRHASGTVILNARIGTDGYVHSLRLLSTPDVDLAIAAIAAARQWTYQPYLLNGQVVDVDTTITVNFRFAQR